MTEYIERAAAMESIIGLTIVDPAVAQYANAVCYNLQNLPAADVAEVRHGRWVWDTTGLYPKPICSRCGEEPYRRSNHTSDLPKYCPNCGARMDKEDEHEVS